jgi:hypothetical protein
MRSLHRRACDYRIAGRFLEAEKEALGDPEMRDCAAYMVLRERR